MLNVFMALTLATASQPASAGDDVASAKSWVELIDGSHWADSWAAAGALFKSHIDQGSWAGQVEPIRAPLGAVASRTVRSVAKTASLPGAPAGEYEILQFDTNFAHKDHAIETVVLAHEASGWKVDGYFIR